MKNKPYYEWSKDRLVHFVDVLLKRKRFGIVWEPQDEEVAEKCKEFLPVLENVNEVKDLIINKNKKFNYIIEGDNYHALSVLNYTHKKAFDCIYIDPPYNNGDKNWKYNNNYVDKNNHFRHSKWLSMMDKRLKHSKRLLKDDGVLICAIDKNEQTHLGVLLEDIFKDYEIHCVAIVHNPRGVQGDNFAYTNEFAFFIFRKGLKIIQRFERSENDIEFRNLRDNGGESLRSDARNCFYKILVKNKIIVGFGDVPNDSFNPKGKNIKAKDGAIEVWPIDNGGVERKWRYARQSVEEILPLLRVKQNRNGDIEIELAKTEDRPKTIWTGTRYDANEYGTKIVKRITGKDFPFPKSLYTVKDCLECVIQNRQDALVLDFFAGSGTTGHAILEMNAEDKGDRRFILCTNNEDNDNTGIKVARDICLPRIQNVIKGYKYEGSDSRILFEKKITLSDFRKSENIWGKIDKLKTDNEDRFDDFEIKITDGILKVIGKSNSSGFQKGLGGNLRYFQTAFVQKIKTDKDKRVFVRKATEMLCLGEETFTEIVTNTTHALYESDEKVSLIIYDESEIALAKRELKKITKPTVVYVFSYDHTVDKTEFEDIANVKVKPIPEVILNVYRKIFKDLYKPKQI
ncbi:MAG: site-specific DNA-methyltransferase [Candidatus Omnitrophota bacterium]